jgi:hypothetical protein
MPVRGVRGARSAAGWDEGVEDSVLRAGVETFTGADFSPPVKKATIFCQKVSFFGGRGVWLSERRLRWLLLPED